MEDQEEEVEVLMELEVTGIVVYSDRKGSDKCTANTRVIRGRSNS